MFPVIRMQAPVVTSRVTSSLSMQLCLTTERKRGRLLGLALRLHFSRDKTCRASAASGKNSFRKHVSRAGERKTAVASERKTNESRKLSGRLGTSGCVTITRRKRVNFSAYGKNEANNAKCREKSRPSDVSRGEHAASANRFLSG